MSADLWKLMANFTIGVTAAVVIVVILRPVVVRVFGARATYGLWLVVPTMTCAVLLPAPVTQEPLVVATSTFLRLGPRPVVETAHLVSGVSGRLQLSLLALWGAGVIVTLFVTLLRQRRYLRSLGHLTQDESGAFRADRATGPALIGICRPRLLLPANFEECHTAMERSFMLAHEEVHRRRADPLMNALAELINCLQWFNPLIRWCHGLYRQDQELACDAIAAGSEVEKRAVYGELLVKTQRSLDEMTLSPIGAAWHPMHPLTARLAALRRRAPSSIASRLGAAAVGLAIVVAAYGGWAMRAEAAAATSGMPIALHVTWSIEHASKDSGKDHVIAKTLLVTDIVVPSGKSFVLFYPATKTAHEYELSCTPKVLPPLVTKPDGKKFPERFWIECAFKRRDGVTLPYHPKMATWDNQEIGVEVKESDGAGGKLVYHVMINPSTSKARIEQAQAAEKRLKGTKAESPSSASP
jgi:beta-lactamase regulating signal transducer with metallopeptidase domain